MENTSATTLTDLVLLDERAALDHDVDGLVSHELAHQWWGDLLTCREWSEAWLNEGFATYFEYIWREHAKGRDEADIELLVDSDSYLAEAGRYQRPVVCRQYDEPIHLFDSHLYEKGGRVLHMLRHELGDAAFLARPRTLRPARTPAARSRPAIWRAAIEETTGRAVDEMFDRWIARPGHPELEGAWSWDDDRKLGTLRLAQKQAIGPDTPPFKFSTLVRFELDGNEQDERVTVSEANHGFEFQLPARPTQVDLRSGRRRAQDDQARQEPRALAPPAGGRAAGDRSRRGGARARRPPRSRRGRGAGHGAARRSPLGRARGSGAGPGAVAPRRRPRPSAGDPRRSRTRGCAAPSPPRSASWSATRRRPGPWPIACGAATRATSSRPRWRWRWGGRARRWRWPCCRA